MLLKVHAPVADLPLKGRLTYEVIDVARGQIIQCGGVDNMVVLAGKLVVRNWLSGGWLPTEQNGITHFGIGTGTTAATLADMDLQIPLFRDIVTQRLVSNNSTTAFLTVKYYLPSNLGNGSNISEAGLFLAASAGSMYARAILSPTINKTASVAVIFQWDLSW